MYNNPSEAIPLKPPVHLQVTLRPWFDDNSLQEGLNLIRERKIHHYFFYRSIAAGFLDSSNPLSIVFAITAKIRQGFTLQEHSCSYCGYRAAKKRCPHLAALAILSLTPRNGVARDLFPMPLHFDKTVSSQIGIFLYGWMGRQPGKVATTLHNDRFKLQKELEQEGITITLPPLLESQWRAFFNTAQTAEEQSAPSAQLIICPASVLYHWKNKIDEFYPQLKHTIFYGADRLLDTASNPGLLITTYTIARLDQELLSEIPFDIILLDEIQNLKNSTTAMHKAVLSFNARVKIGLTGTPIENSLTDLHALFSLCLPGFFGDKKSFTRNFLYPIKENKNKEVKERLRRLIQPFILRRNRKQVLTELPDLIIDDRTCELSDTQIKLYRDIIDESQEILDVMELEEASVKYINILAMLTRLKQICNHPCLLEGCRDAEEYESGKWNLFVELLSECLEANLKIVVFSQYTGMLDIIEHYLDRTGIGYARLRGNMAIPQREKMLDTFRKDTNCKVFCASLLAGGTGIDLITAQVVIHYDRWWNPAKEAQATARVHRMGQKEQVQVFRLITSGTLEEKIHLLLKEKQEMADSLISEDEGGVIKKLDRSHLRELFRLG